MARVRGPEQWREDLAPLGLLGPLDMKSSQTRANFVSYMLF